MQIANVLAGYSLGEADLLRRAMGKKDPEEMAKQRERFMSGAAEAWASQGHGRRDLRPDGEVRRLRLQQVALGGVCAAGVSDGVAEDALSGGVHGGAADHRNLEAGERGEVHRRVPRDGHRRRAARCAGFATRTSRRTARRSASGWRRSRTWAATRSNRSSRRAKKSAEAASSSFWEFCEKVDLRVMNKRVIESLIKAGALDSLGNARPAVRRGRQGDGARAEGAEGCGAGPDGPVRPVRRNARATASTATICPACRTGKRASASPTRRRCWASSSPAIRWTSTPRRLRNLAGMISTAEACERKPAERRWGQRQRSRRRDSGGRHHSRTARAKERSATRNFTRRPRSKTPAARSI